VRKRSAGGTTTGSESWLIPLADTDSGAAGPARLCDERALMVDPLKLFWVITNSTYLGTCERGSLKRTRSEAPSDFTRVAGSPHRECDCVPFFARFPSPTDLESSPMSTAIMRDTRLGKAARRRKKESGKRETPLYRGKLRYHRNIAMLESLSITGTYPLISSLPIIISMLPVITGNTSDNC